MRAKSPKRIPHPQTTDNHGIRYISYCPILQLDMRDICGLDGFWVFVPSTSVSVQVQRMQREARNTQLCHQAVLPSQKVGEGGTRLNSLGLWWIRCFWAAQGSLAKLHGETNPGECSCFQKVWEGGPMAKFPGGLVAAGVLVDKKKFSQRPWSCIFLLKIRTAAPMNFYSSS